MIIVKEKTLLRIALAASIIGIAVLFIISQRIKVDEAMINKLEQSVDETVFVSGTVVGINTVNSTTFLRIQKDEITSAVLFGETPEIAEGDYVQIRGKVTKDGDEASIIGEEVRVI
jgi:RecJ-like exonuclease